MEKERQDAVEMAKEENAQGEESKKSEEVMGAWCSQAS